MTPAMSSWGVKKPVRTYSRQKKRVLEDEDEERPTKQRRVEIPKSPLHLEAAYNVISDSPVSSSPPSEGSRLSKRQPTIFSDEPLNSTPPSSPQPQNSPSKVHTRRPVFSFLKRKVAPTSSAQQPLSNRSDNIPGPIKPPQKKTKLVQMQLDLVGELRKTCKTCGMEYIPSNSEDAALHRKFHALNVGGVDLSKAVIERLRNKQIWTGSDGSFISAIGRKDPLALRNKAFEVLKVVNTELAAVDIPEEALWSQIRTQTAPIAGSNAAGVPGKGNRHNSTSDRFKTYLYIKGQKCVGLCLAERIQDAHAVLDQEQEEDWTSENTTNGMPGPNQHSSSISVATSTEAAMMGVSRIWTSKLQRKAGIASRLLDAARCDFLYGMTIEKQLVAFSQPTESGGQLARKWFGRRAGWHVYMD